MPRFALTRLSDYWLNGELLYSIRYPSFKRKNISLIIFGAIPTESLNLFSAFCVLFFFVISVIVFLIREYLVLLSSKFFLISLSALIALATLSILFPLFGYSFALLSTASLVFLPLPDYSFLNKFKLVQKSILFSLCNILKDSGLLNFLSTLYLIVWCLPTKKFFRLVFSFFIISIFYLLISRYYFLTTIIENKAFTLYESLLIYLSLVIGLITLYCKIMLNLSLITINYTIYNHKELLSPNFILMFESEGNPMPDSTPPPTGKGLTQFVFFQRNHNNVHNSIPNAIMNRRMGFVGLFCTICIGTGTIFYAKKTYDAQRDNNFQMERQNDLEEVSQNLMTREDYIRKYGKGPR